MMAAQAAPSYVLENTLRSDERQIAFPMINTGNLATFLS